MNCFYLSPLSWLQIWLRAAGGVEPGPGPRPGLPGGGAGIRLRPHALRPAGSGHCGPVGRPCPREGVRQALRVPGATNLPFDSTEWVRATPKRPFIDGKITFFTCLSVVWVSLRT
jgi:hypothetical protein